MQTFLPLPTYAESAAVLDNKRLGKQRVENLQIVKAILTGPRITERHAAMYDGGDARIGKSTPWFNHPAAAMWRKNWASLLCYHEACVTEWTKRGFSDSTYDKMRQLVVDMGERVPSDTGQAPPFIGDDKFHSSHRAILLDKDAEYYGRNGWSETRAEKVDGSYPYFWPTKQEKYSSFFAP